MKIPRAAVMAAAASASSTVAAFSIRRTGGTSTSFLGRSVQQHGLQHRTMTSSTTTMLFGNLFGGGGGGAFEQKIVYDNLVHPGPELAKLAQEGKVPAVSERSPNLALATFAGGCFWGFELAYQRVPGVEYTAVGYTQGPEDFPTYNQVCAGATGHTEAVVVYYNPTECSYESLLDTFFGRIDITTVNGQGGDRG
jgi:hypothetical protein